MRGWLKKTLLSSKISDFEDIQEERVFAQDEIHDLLFSKKELYDIHLDEVSKWTQGAKDKWIKDGDANTKHFHTLSSHNFKKIYYSSVNYQWH
jgi:hypothetical protein